jgi:hypothetical protein
VLNLTLRLIILMLHRRRGVLLHLGRGLFVRLVLVRRGSFFFARFALLRHAAFVRSGLSLHRSLFIVFLRDGRREPGRQCQAKDRTAGNASEHRHRITSSGPTNDRLTVL